MSLTEDGRPIFIKKIPPPPAEAHGGAWKVAYADFVTAMMAFFLLLWLLNATTTEQKQGISNFFEPEGAIKGSSGSGGMFGGLSSTDPGSEETPGETKEMTIGTQASTENEFENQSKLQKKKPKVSSPVEVEREEQEFEAARLAIREAMEDLPELKELKASIVTDVTEEGLRIQIIDQNNLAMYQAGTAKLNGHGKKLLLLVASVVERLPNKLSFAGHTGQSNWGLSLGRANAARRELVRNGMPTSRVANVVGKANRELVDAKNKASPKNRRVSIVLLRKEIKKSDGAIPEPPRMFGG
ncbi:MAG: flagellar motor protein MotB [Alphaproteobacteria bacterium]|jgi:chemotaxis protein MotB|nr:flagellar motor protein MotB [Alphaproteobacteria bacterium]|tara:strand:- start:512 stop:1405 length:894 start_codon:yes stop_codon:yes gene_type:complete